jgi:hypothetical protein
MPLFDDLLALIQVDLPNNLMDQFGMGVADGRH